MKRFLLTVIAVCIAVIATAQPGSRTPRENDKKGPMKIEELISDLSKTQKTKIDNITKRTTKTIDNYRQQLNSVRDSIRSYMESPNDHSNILFPLYEREGRLQAEISKEYYRCKVAIDKLLTPEQYRTLKEQMDKHKHHRDAKRKSPSASHKPSNK